MRFRAARKVSSSAAACPKNASFLDYIGYDEERLRFVWLDLQDRGRIQRELAEFESHLTKLSPAETLATRVPLNEGGTHD